MAAAKHSPVLGDQRPHALAMAKRGALLDAIFRMLGAPAEGAEARRVAVELDRIVLPHARRDHSAVEVDDARKLPAVEAYLRCRHRKRVDGPHQARSPALTPALGRR